MFDQLEAFLKVGADAGLRSRFNDEFSVDRVKEKTDRLGGFGTFSPDDLFHGDHVSERLGVPGGHQGFLNEQAVRRIREAFAWHFETFGWSA